MKVNVDTTALALTAGAAAVFLGVPLAVQLSRGLPGEPYGKPAPPSTTSILRALSPWRCAKLWEALLGQLGLVWLAPAKLRWDRRYAAARRGQQQDGVALQTVEYRPGAELDVFYPEAGASAPPVLFL